MFNTKLDVHLGKGPKKRSSSSVNPAQVFSKNKNQELSRAESRWEKRQYEPCVMIPSFSFKNS